MDQEIYINQPLTSQKIMEILEENPELEKIKCPPSIYHRIAPKYLDALSKLGIEVEVEIKRGRPKKYKKKDKETIGRMLKQGHSPQEISDTLNIPLKTVYYFNEKPLKRGRKRKYSPAIEKEVKNLHKKGISVKDISKKLNIPLRTVYGLIKR